MRISSASNSAPLSVTPVSLPEGIHALFSALRSRARPIALLETGGSHGMAILAWDPAVIVRMGEGAPQVWSDPHVEPGRLPRTRGEVMGFLDRLLDRFPTQTPTGGGAVTGFPGGLIGYVSYEWAVGQEGPDSPRLVGFPDLWFGLFDRAVVASPQGATRLVVAPTVRGADPVAVRRSLALARSPGPWHPSEPSSAPQFVPSWPRADFVASVREVRRCIRRGDVYQVNLALQLRTRGIDPWRLYEQLCRRNPSPFAGVLNTGDVTIVSGSPERLFRVSPASHETQEIEARPIAGTRPRSGGLQDYRNERALRRSPKEKAEHTMLVDLARNDLGRVCSAGSVEVDEWLTVERYSHVMHLVSNVRGLLGERVGTSDLFRALMPGGTVTGTPKIRATEMIAELEPVPRGPYTGSLGYIGLDGRMDFNLLIRSAFFGPRGSPAYVYAGAGIVEDSRPEREWDEVRSKTAVVLEASSGRKSRGFPWRPPRRYTSWRPPKPAHRYPNARVLLIDSYDSFTFNLAQYLSMFGARVQVVRNDHESLARLRSSSPTHVVISPGPGRPEQSGFIVPAVRAFEGTPLLGVCLGHEAIIEAYGGTLGAARCPVHGKLSTVRRVAAPKEGGLLEGLSPTFRATRYHSLVARTVPEVLRVTARTLEGEVMAVEHREFPTYGVQFHPESFRTEQGMPLLDRFLLMGSPHG